MVKWKASIDILLPNMPPSIDCSSPEMFSVTLLHLLGSLIRKSVRELCSVYPPVAGSHCLISSLPYWVSLQSFAMV